MRTTPIFTRFPILAERHPMRKSLVALLIGSASGFLSGSAQADDPVRATSVPILTQFQVDGVEPKAADSDSPLPVGFPTATAPGAIEVKTYPVYRSAVAKGQGMAMRSGDSLFWSLFRHIEKNEIAMTAPVINTYPNELVESPEARGEVTMEFLYREPTQGTTGPDGTSVEVLDHPEGRYVCLGIQGGMNEPKMREGIAALKGWLAEHSSEWVEDGPPRRLGYHGPMTQTRRRLWEVQIPIKPATAAAAAEAPAAEPAP